MRGPPPARRPACPPMPSHPGAPTHPHTFMVCSSGMSGARPLSSLRAFSELASVRRPGQGRAGGRAAAWAHQLRHSAASWQAALHKKLRAAAVALLRPPPSSGRSEHPPQGAERAPSPARRLTVGDFEPAVAEEPCDLEDNGRQPEGGGLVGHAMARELLPAPSRPTEIGCSGLGSGPRALSLLAAPPPPALRDMPRMQGVALAPSSSVHCSSELLHAPVPRPSLQAPPAGWLVQLCPCKALHIVLGR